MADSGTQDEQGNNRDTMWIVVNVILCLYAIGLGVYGKYFRKKDLTLYKDYVEEKGLYSREDSAFQSDKNAQSEKLI